VLASEFYDEKDYFRDYSIFLKAVSKLHTNQKNDKR